MDVNAVEALLGAQDGVVGRRQLLPLGVGDHDVARLVRRREWVALHPGVYVSHTGPPTASQREWAAVLVHAPAALTGHSALRRYGVRTGRDATSGRSSDAGGPEVVSVAVAGDRRVQPRPGIEVARLGRFAADVLGNLSPPRVRLEMVLLDLASSAADDAAAVAVLADGVGSHRTTADRLLAALQVRSRLPRRAFLVAVLTDVASGVHSVLERKYLHDVERAHGLPPAGRQVSSGAKGRCVRRDVEHADQRVVVELDGRLGHELA
ncbi:MAG: hypothetical protein JWR20_1577, partial [Marmoricola sp.]|nr:hypothetical protein [Marmoricola sp.]